MNSRRSLWLLLGSLALFGCGDGTAPSGDSSVAVRVLDVRDPEVVESPGAILSYRCHVDLEATHSGGQPSEWLSATAQFYTDLDRSIPTFLDTISYADIQAAFGSTHMSSGVTRHGTLAIAGPVPYAATISFGYRPYQQATRSDTVDFSCGPQPASGAPAPTVDILSRAPLTSVVQPGQTIRIEYRAAAAAGLWQSSVVGTGPCPFRQDFTEALDTVATHVVTFLVPALCPPDSLHIDVRASDITLRAASRAAIYEVADRTRPLLNAILIYQSNYNFFFAGDSVQVYVDARDNSSLAWLVWKVEPDGTADSVALSGGAFQGPIKVQVPSETPFQVRLWARDRAALVSDTIVTTPAVPVYSEVTMPYVADSFSGRLAIKIDAPRTRIYAIGDQYGAGVKRLLSISATTLAPLDSVVLPNPAWDMDLVPSGDSLLVMMSTAIGVVDLTTGTLTMSVVPVQGLAPNQRIGALRVGANGKVFANLRTSPPSGGETGVLVEVDLANGSTSTRTDAGNAGRFAGALERSADGSTIVLYDYGVLPTLFQRYDAVSDLFDPPTSTHSQGTLSMTATGTRSAVAADIYDVSLSLERRVQAELNTFVSVLSPDGATLYHASPYNVPESRSPRVLRSDVASGVFLDGIALPWTPNGIVASPDGSFLVALRLLDNITRMAVIQLP